MGREANANHARKLGYLSGPVDARRIYDSLVHGTHTDLFGTSYLRHLMQVCEDEKRDAVIVTTHGDERYDIQLGRFKILNRPVPRGRSLRFHLRQVWWTYEILVEMEQAGVGTTVLTAAQHYWFVTPTFRMRGMKFINSYHCSLRALGHKRFSPHEVFIRLTSKFHLSKGDPTMVIAPTIGEELAREAGVHKRRTIQIFPDYDRAIFQDMVPPNIAISEQPIVHVIYAGRITRNKGVFDILSIAEKLASRTGPEVHFHLHGEGDALELLRQKVHASSHGHLVHLYGFTAGEDLKTHYAEADIVLVPTRSDFEEGIAKSVVEGVLTLRPVVTSRACPSIHLLSGACSEAEVDDPESYAAAIWRLANDPDLADAKVQAAVQLREIFFDPPERYDRQLKQALAIAEA